MQIELASQYINAAHSANCRQEFKAAVEFCNKALKLAPNLPEAWYNLGIAKRRLGKRSEALHAHNQARLFSPNSADAQNSIGLELLELKAYRDAEHCLRRALALAPDYAFPHSNLGRLLESLERLEEAEACCTKAVELEPNLAPLHANLAGVLNSRKRFEAAESACRKAIELDPALPQAWNNLSVALHGSKCFVSAEAASRKSIELDPDSPEGWCNFGVALQALNKFAASEVACRKAIELDPKAPQAWSNLGGALLGLNRFDEAEAACRSAIRADPNWADSYQNLGVVLRRSKRYPEAADCFAKLLALSPDYDFAKGELLHTKMFCCDWQGLTELHDAIVADLKAGRPSAEPFGLMAISDSEVDRLRCATQYTSEKYPRQGLGSVLPGVAPDRRIRVGYVSGEFRTQATSILMTELFELHDRSRFEIYAFDNGWDDGGQLRARMNAAFHEIVNIRGLGDADAAGEIGKRSIDILVDLNGFFGGARQGVFSNKPCPVQVSYLGFPGTLGADYIDYIVADRTVIPEDNKIHYSEKIVYLPDCYQVNDTKRRIAEKSWSREKLGLPETGFVYCCFNNSYKITPQTFKIWMHVLKQVDDAVLWLLEDSQAAVRNLRLAAEREGVAPGRLVFAKRLPNDEHLARHRVADLFLDTSPCNAHTTASDALWAGLPLLTRLGHTFPGRVAASLLYAVGLPELVAQDESDYQARAIALAREPRRLSRLRETLVNNLPTSPLFDSRSFARHLEAAYLAMVDRCRAGQSPEHIHVQPGPR